GVKGVGVDVYRSGLAARVVDRARRGKERERGRNDVVPRFQIQRLEGKQQRIGPARTADAMLRMRQLGDLRLELPDAGTHDELLRLDNRLQGGNDLVLDGPVLADEIQ